MFNNPIRTGTAGTDLPTTPNGPATGEPSAVAKARLKSGRLTTPKALRTVIYQSIVRDTMDDMAALLPLFMRRRQMRHEVSDDNGPRQEMPTLPPGAITKVEMLRDLLQQIGHANSQRWLSMAFEIFPDASDLALALIALGRTEGLSEEEQIKVAEAYRTLLESEGRQKVLAGVNATRSAQLFAQRLDCLPDGLRKTYRLLVMTQLSEHVMYRYLIDTFGFAHRHAVIDYLEVALAADIQSADPSCTAEEFGRLLGLLYQLRLLRSADIVFIGSMRQGRLAVRRKRDRAKRPRAGGARAGAAEEEGLAKQEQDAKDGQDAKQEQDAKDEPVESDDERLLKLLLAGLADADTLGDRVDQAYDALYADEDAALFSAFLQRLFDGFRLIPVELFPSLAHRDKVLTVIGRPLGTIHFPMGVIGARNVIDA